MLECSHSHTETADHLYLRCQALFMKLNTETSPHSPSVKSLSIDLPKAHRLQLSKSGEGEGR